MPSTHATREVRCRDGAVITIRHGDDQRWHARCSIDGMTVAGIPGDVAQDVDYHADFHGGIADRSTP